MKTASDFSSTTLHETWPWGGIFRASAGKFVSQEFSPKPNQHELVRTEDLLRHEMTQEVCSSVICPEKITQGSISPNQEMNQNQEINSI